MKRLSNALACASRLIPWRALLWSTLIVAAVSITPVNLNAQDRGWSLTGSVGYALLSLDRV
ncbi:MAG: hypothetical protein AABZ02_13060, partial [Bacteroidota bacterium]